MTDSRRSSGLSLSPRGSSKDLGFSTSSVRPPSNADSGGGGGLFSGANHTSSGSFPCASSPPPTFAVHSPDGEEEHPLFDEDAVVPLVELPPPPDGGWGWVICFASFMCNLILDGIAYTFGVLLEPLVESFDSNRSTVSWVGSLLAGVYLTSGPIVGGLVNKFGCRPVCIGGSIVSCIGLVLSVFSPNVPVLMLTYGVIGGFGLGLIYLPAVVAVGYYFEKRRALATGISVCGSGVGTFLFAPLATKLLKEYGWKGANLIFAGLCLNCAVFGALMRPLELTTRPVTLSNKKRDDEDNYLLEADEDNNQFVVQLPDGTHEVQTKEDYSLTPNTSFSMNQDIGAMSPSINLSQLPTIAEQSITKQDQDQKVSVLDVFPPSEPKQQHAPPPLQHQQSVPAVSYTHLTLPTTPYV